jgi:hypothetical protein
MKRAIHFEDWEQEFPDLDQLRPWPQLQIDKKF